MPLAALKRLLNFSTHRIYNLPVLVMMPHSRCNCRCVMCDIWKANHEKKEISASTLRQHIRSFKELGVREIVFSGGEALMHSNLWEFAALLRAEDIKLTLLSTGLLLARNAKLVVENLSGVIVSLDGSRTIHDEIRQVPNAFDRLVEGVRSLKAVDQSFPVTARCVLQKGNYADLPNIIIAARETGLDQISFLSADVSSGAFNRHDPWSQQKVSDISLSADETEAFAGIVEKTFTDFSKEYQSKFIAESPDKMRRLVQYYRAVNASANFPEPVCNAPWVSAVIESDGTVLPCFFHKPYGSIYDNDFLSVINSPGAVSFRKNLKMSQDETCKRCVCSLKLGLTQMN